MNSLFVRLQFKWLFDCTINKVGYHHCYYYHSISYSWSIYCSMDVLQCMSRQLVGRTSTHGTWYRWLYLIILALLYYVPNSPTTPSPTLPSYWHWHYLCMLVEINTIPNKHFFLFLHVCSSSFSIFRFHLFEKFLFVCVCSLQCNCFFVFLYVISNGICCRISLSTNSLWISFIVISCCSFATCNSASLAISRRAFWIISFQ